jgi:hypothetical protein
MRTLSFFSCLFIAIVFCGCSYFTSDEEKLIEFIKKVNKKCPAMVDSETRIDSVEFRDGTTLRYNYTLVNVIAEKVDTAAFNRALWPGLLSNLRLSPDMQKLREDGLNAEYLYNDRSGKRISVIRITPSHYNSGFRDEK